MRQTLSQCPVSSKPLRVYYQPSLQDSCCLPSDKEELWRNNHISVRNTEDQCKEIPPMCLKAKTKPSRYSSDYCREADESDSNVDFQSKNCNRQQQEEGEEYQQQQLSQLNFKSYQDKRSQQFLNLHKPFNNYRAMIAAKCIPLQYDSRLRSKTTFKQPIPFSSYENIFNRMPPYSYRMSKQSKNNNCQNTQSSPIIPKVEQICQKKQNKKITSKKYTESSVIGEFAVPQGIPEKVAAKELQRGNGYQEFDDIPQVQNKNSSSKYNQDQGDYQDEIQYLESDCLNNKNSNQSLPSLDPSQNCRQLDKHNTKQQQKQLQCYESQPNQILKQKQQGQSQGKSHQPQKTQVECKKSQEKLSNLQKQKQQSMESCSRDFFSSIRQKQDTLDDSTSSSNGNLICVSCENKEIIVKKALQQQLQKAKQDLYDKLVQDAIQECGHSKEVSQMISECLKKREMAKYLNQQLIDKYQKEICEKQKQSEIDESNKKQLLEALQKEKEEKVAQLKSQREIIQQEMRYYQQLKCRKQKREKEIQEQYKEQQDQAIFEANQRDEEEEERKRIFNKAHIDGLKSQIKEKQCISMNKKEDEISFFRYQEEMNRSIESKARQLAADTRARNIGAQIESIKEQQKFKEHQKNLEICEDRRLREIQEEDNEIQLMNEANINAQIQEMKDQARSYNMQQIGEKANAKALERKKDLELERMLQVDLQRKEKESITKVMPCNQCNFKFPLSHLNKNKTKTNGFSNVTLQSEECNISNEQIIQACDVSDQQ